MFFGHKNTLSKSQTSVKGYDEVDRYIQETNMLDYSDIHIQMLIQNRGWLELSVYGVAVKGF